MSNTALQGRVLSSPHLLQSKIICEFLMSRLSIGNMAAQEESWSSSYTGAGGEESILILLTRLRNSLLLVDKGKEATI